MTSSSFVNEQLHQDTLPALQTLIKQPLSANYAKFNRMIRLFTTLFFVVTLFGIMQQTFHPFSVKTLDLLTYACWLVAALGFLNTAYGMLADPKKSYALREHDLSYSSGLIFRKTVTQPVLRIQHIELKRGPIERKIGLATLQVFSAGGALETFQIPGLPLTEAQKLREFILRHKGSTQNA